MKKSLTLILVLFYFLNVPAQTWTQIGSDIDGETAEGFCGYDVSISSDGSVLAVGEDWNDENGTRAGQVRVFENISGTWTQKGQDLNGEAAYNMFGVSIGLSSNGSILAVGEKGFDVGSGEYNQGRVKIFEYTSGSWIQIGSDIIGEAADDYSGTLSLSSDGSIIAIGANNNDENGTMSGHVRIFKNDGGDWIQIGEDINGEAASDLSGSKVCLSSDGSIVAIAAHGNDGGGSAAGQVRVFENISDSWIQIGDDIEGENILDQSGTSLSLNSAGSIVAIGAIYSDGNGENAGHVRVFENNEGIWTQIGEDIDGETAEDNFGFSSSLNSDGTMVAIGAFNNDGNGENAGQVRVFGFINSAWTQIGEDIDGEAAGDQSGNAVSLNADGSIVAVGAFKNDGNGVDAGHVRVYGLVENEVAIVTNDVTDITPTSATGNANITVTGSPNLIQHGVCWNTIGNPSIADNYTEEGSATAGEFSSEIIGLTPNQTYYIKAYVTTDIETIYGNELSFTTLNNVGIESIDQNRILIHPNPTNGIFIIDFHKAGKSNIKILDITGKIIFDKQYSIGSKQVIDISNQPSGVYFIKIESENSLRTEKIIKK